jgi:ADP-heptose:LPS heptosyltransferase
MQPTPKPKPEPMPPPQASPRLLQLPGKIYRRLLAYCEPIPFIMGTVLPLWLKTGRRPVLLSRYMALGDLICALPAVLELIKRHAGAPVIFHCREDYGCLLRMAGINARVVSRLNIYMIQTAYAGFFSGVYRFTYADESEKSASAEAIIGEFCRQHRLPVTDDHPRLAVDPAVMAKVKGLLQQRRFLDAPFAVIHPGPSWAVREWPSEFWARLVQDLSEHGCKNIVQLGAGQLGAVGTALEQPIPGVWSLVNELSLEESMALVSLARLVVGIESGMLHVAAVFHVPAIGLFGPTSAPSRYSARSSVIAVSAPVECQGCHHRYPRLHWTTGCPHDIACMKAISPAMVLRECLPLIGRGRAVDSAPVLAATAKTLSAT